MTYDCMTPEELALWSENQVARARAKLPCSDCPLWFELEERAAGRCCREQVASVRSEHPGRPRHGAHSEHRRAQWRAAKVRQRAAERVQ